MKTRHGSLPRHKQGTQMAGHGQWQITTTVTAFLFLVDAQNTNALPVYATQTAQPCTACHVGGFGPQLTPFGRQFKLEGYTLSGTQDFVLPLSAMAVAS